VLFILPMFAMAAARVPPGDPVTGDHPGAQRSGAGSCLVGFGGPAILQNIVIAMAVFRRPAGRPRVSRAGVGYFNVWAALLFLPGLLVICFQGGPFRVERGCSPSGCH